MAGQVSADSEEAQVGIVESVLEIVALVGLNAKRKTTHAIGKLLNCP
jgi:hypothetical protein